MKNEGKVMENKEKVRKPCPRPKKKSQNEKTKIQKKIRTPINVCSLQTKLYCQTTNRDMFHNVFHVNLEFVCVACRERERERKMIESQNVQSYYLTRVVGQTWPIRFAGGKRINCSLSLAMIRCDPLTGIGSDKPKKTRGEWRGSAQLKK